MNILNVKNIPVTTSPYHESSKGVTETGNYYHILVRNGQSVYVFVQHFGAEELPGENQRAEKFIRVAGSDHYPLE